MSLIITRNFKRAKAQDAAAQDIKLPFIITFNNGKKEFREGYSEEEVRRRFDKSIAALYGGIKSVKLEGEDKRDGKDSIAADANFKKGDKVTVKTKWAGTRKGIVKEVINDPALKKAYVVEIEGAETAAYPAEIVSEDACEDSGELNNDADLRAALSKMADIAKRLTDAKVSFKAGWTPEGVGEISLEFPDSESARRYNYYKLFNAWEAAENQITPRWATGFSGFKIPRVDGNRITIGILHFST